MVVQAIHSSRQEQCIPCLWVVGFSDFTRCRFNEKGKRRPLLLDKKKEETKWRKKIGLKECEEKGMNDTKVENNERKKARNIILSWIF